MLREILTNGFVDKNINLSKKKTESPKKPSEIRTKAKKPQSFKQLNLNQVQKDFNLNSKPIFNEKIEMIKQRPDFLINQNMESTNPTLNNNKQLLKSPNFLNQNEYSDIGELDSNNNIDDININNLYNNNINNKKIESAKEKNDNNMSNINNKIKQETDGNIEFNMTMLSPEGIDKIKLLEEYLSQIKENSNEINENKIQELQSQKEQLEYNVKYLSNNIILTKKNIMIISKSKKIY